MHSRLQQQHLFWRAGFGPTPEMLFQSAAFKPPIFVSALLKASETIPPPFTLVQNMADGLANGFGELGRQQMQDSKNLAGNANNRALKQQQNRQATRSLNLAWLDEMVHSPAQLREKMALFWHGHFACRNLNSYFQQQLINVIRTYALSDFGTLLAAVSKTPAMLQFLNNQQNRKNSPNENFAREVMELFTLGRGHYQEKDVKEAARAFTGWGFNIQGQFQFRPFQHDEGQKTVLGYRGNLSGDDVLDILLKQKQTAIFICTKIYRYFVDENVNTTHVSWLAERFFQSGYQIKPLLQDIFTASWFYDAQHIGNQIKSPVVLLAGIRRQLPMDIENPETQLILQRALGQILFYPPGVAGWPSGKSWIDSSSLLLRIQLPQLLAQKSDVDLRLKNDDDTEMGMGGNYTGIKQRFGIKATIDWASVLKPFESIETQNRYTAIVESVLQTKTAPRRTFINNLIQDSNDAAQIIVALMSLPEYQLC